MRAVSLAALACALSFSLTVSPSPACTSFCLDTPEGPIFGVNLDLLFPADGLVFMNRRGIAKGGFRPGTTGATLDWVSQYGSVSFSLAGAEFAWGGMNEAGLVVSMLELKAGENPEPDERPALSLGTWAQYVLDNCGTVEEVIELDEKVRIQDTVPPAHFLIADAAGECAALEWFDGRLVYRTGEDLPVKAMSNMPYGRALAAYERGGPRFWWSNPGRSAERFAGAAERNEHFDPKGDTDAVSYAFGTLVDVVAVGWTQWSVVYDIAKREVWYGSARSRPAKHIALDDFDLSCESPLLMLDVNAPVAGDVAPHFAPYDHDANLMLFRTLCEGYEIEVSDEGADGLMQLIESFECAQESVPHIGLIDR